MSKNVKRAISCLLLIYTAVYLLNPAALQAAEKEIVISDQKRPDGKKEITAVFYLDTEPELIYGILKDVRKFPEFMPDSEKVDMIEEGDNFHIVKFSGAIGPFDSIVVMKRVFNDQDKSIEWVQLEGLAKEVSGLWKVEGNRQGEKGTKVFYSNYVNAGKLVPPFMVRRYMKKNILQMVDAIKNRVNTVGKKDNGAGQLPGAQ